MGGIKTSIKSNNEGIAVIKIKGARKPNLSDHLNGRSVKYPVIGLTMIVQIVVILIARPTNSIGSPISTS